MDVTGLEILSVNSFSSDDGRGSREHDLDGDFRIKVLTSTWETISNSGNEQDGVPAGREHDMCWSVDLISDLRLSIFSEKKFINLLARS